MTTVSTDFEAEGKAFLTILEFQRHLDQGKQHLKLKFQFARLTTYSFINFEFSSGYLFLPTTYHFQGSVFVALFVLRLQITLKITTDLEHWMEFLQVLAHTFSNGVVNSMTTTLFYSTSRSRNFVKNSPQGLIPF